MATTVFILNGPNLNLLGARQPEVYGRDTLDDIEAAARAEAAALTLSIDFRQTNHEGTLIDWIHEAEKNAKGLIINPGAYTHTSLALYDALSAVGLPKVELHLSNIHAREEFRRRSLTAAGVDAVIMGLGAPGYRLALKALKTLIETRAA